jgi:hypothetical protein
MHLLTQDIVAKHVLILVDWSFFETLKILLSFRNLVEDTWFCSLEVNNSTHFLGD